MAGAGLKTFVQQLTSLSWDWQDKNGYSATLTFVPHEVLSCPV